MKYIRTAAMCIGCCAASIGGGLAFGWVISKLIGMIG